MDPIEKEVGKQLRSHLKDVSGSSVESLVKRILSLPYERVALATEIAIMLAAANPRVAVEMLKAAPEVSRLVAAGDLRVWGEVCKRLSATSNDTATEFIRATPSTLESIPASFRSQILRLINKQAALSANTAVESFKSAPVIIQAIEDSNEASQVLDICLELARHSVKHSNDLLSAAPGILSRLRAAAPRDELRSRALALTAAFAFRSGSTAAEFFSDLPQIMGSSPALSIEKLFEITEEYLERSGGVALQYFKAAGCVLALAGEEAFEKWTWLARRVSLQGNAASYHFMKSSPQIITDLASRSGQSGRAKVIRAVLDIVSRTGHTSRR